MSIKILVTIFVICCYVWTIFAIWSGRPKYWLVNYSIENGRGSLQVVTKDGSPINFEILRKNLNLDNGARGKIIIESFQRITKEQFEQFGRADWRILEVNDDQ